MEKIDKEKVKENNLKFRDWAARKFEAGEIDNEGLLEFFKDIGHYLNLETIPAYAKRTGMSYQGVKVSRRIEEIFGVKFVIEND